MRFARPNMLAVCVIACVTSLAVALLASCGGSATPTPKPQPSFTPTQIAVITPESQAKAQSDKVWVAPGGSTTLSPLGGSWTPLPAQSKMTTDENGEGLIDLLNGCMLVYVLWNGQLITSGCPKSGGVTCAIQGTSIYNNTCSTQVQIDSLSASMTLIGTWVSVTYNPASQTTAVIVLSGSVRVRPVLNLDTSALGPPVTVQKGFFWFSAPDSALPTLRGLPSRQALPIKDLPSLSGFLSIAPWIDRIAEQSVVDNVAVPGLAAAPPAGPAVNVQTAGGPFAPDGRVQEAMLRAVPWAELAKSVYDGQDVPINVDLQGQSVDARTIPYDMNAAQELLAEAGYPEGFGLYVLYRSDDARLAQLAKQLLEPLASVGIKGLLDPQASDNDLATKLKTYIAAGSAVIWLSSTSVAQPSGQAILLMTGGSALADDAVNEAVLRVVPWAELASSIFGSQSPPINIELGGKTIDVRSIPYDPKTGQQVLQERYPNGFAATLLYAPDDDQLTRLAVQASEFLRRLGIRAEAVAVPPGDAMMTMREVIGSGGNVLWFGR